MNIEPGTYTASFDVDGNGKADAVTFTVEPVGKGEVFKISGEAVLDSGQALDLGSAKGHNNAALSFQGKNGVAEGTFTVRTLDGGLGAVTFKGVEQGHIWYDLNTGQSVEFFPEIQKFRNEYKERVYNVDVTRSFGVSKQ